MNQTLLIYHTPIPGNGIYKQCKVTFGFSVHDSFFQKGRIRITVFNGSKMNS